MAHVDKLVLQVPAHGLLGDLLPASPPATGAVAARRVQSSNEVNVTCQGPFRFDFQKSVASLEDRVDIVRDNPDGHGDQLNCDRLQIFFDRSSASPAADPNVGTPPAADRNTVQKLAVRRIEAQGFPVTLQAPSVAVMARGQQFSYDFQTRRILLADEQNALLVYRQHRAEAPKLEYELHAEPKRLGRLWASGPGSYQGQFGETADQTLTANWCGVLELQPQEGLHVLSVVQGADIQWNGMGSFAADELHVWLAEVPVPERADRSCSARPIQPPPADATQRGTGALPNPTSPSAVDPSPTAPPPPQRLEIRPVKMLAQGNVHADSKQFQGQTPRLEIWFDHPEDAPKVAVDAPPENPAPPSNAPRTPRHSDRWMPRRLEMT